MQQSANGGPVAKPVLTYYRVRNTYLMRAAHKFIAVPPHFPL
jgi:hypothetical protein